MAKKKSETSADKKKEAVVKAGSKVSLHNIYDECNSQMRVLDFYKIELKYLQKRLDEVAKKNTDKEIMAQVEQFQNQFILTKENMDVLNHSVKALLKNVEKLIKQKPTHFDEKSISGSGKNSQRVHDVEKQFAQMKLRFNKFLSKYL
jgi:hypothetical protein